MTSSSTTGVSLAQSTTHPFGNLLRHYRLSRGLTQAKLADLAGLSTRGVNDLERGARVSPHPATIALLADALSLEEDERAALTACVRRPHAIKTRAVASVPVAITPPTGTVTFLFTDIEGSTRLLKQLGARYSMTLEAHQRLLRNAFNAYEGYEVDTQGDSFLVAFPTARAALDAAIQAQRALARYTWPEESDVRVRMGLHTGSPTLAGDRYIGLDVHRAARINAAAHGGQILLSSTTAELVRGVPGVLPSDTALRDLGVHRIKDLSAPERLWQVVVEGLPDLFPPPRALDRRAHNLPIRTTALLGRKREVTEIAQLLLDGAWLVTVTGPPGVGKTRLALQVAAELVDAAEAFPDGIWFVRLARLNDPTLVIATIANELGLRGEGARFITEMLRDYLAEKRLLLVIDNFEHVAAAASELADLLHLAPNVGALVTSRAPLHLRGEREYTLAALPVPAVTRDAKDSPSLLGELGQFASVSLFCERSQAAVADFRLTPSNASSVAAICSRLDGLPLALELAAARVKLLSPAKLLTRLERALPLLSSGGPRDVDERQQTMRATLAWSYNLLSPDEQRLFRRLAVFAGGATLEAIEQVCEAPDGVEPQTGDLLDLLGALIDASLAQRREEADGEPRYTLLFVVREFGLEQLEASAGGQEAEALRRAHALRFLAFAEQAEQDLEHRLDQREAWQARLERDIDNFRAALAWARERGEAAVGLRMATSLYWLWGVHNYLREGRLWMESLLEGVPASQTTEQTVDVPLAVRARAYMAAGSMAIWNGDRAAGERYTQAAVTLARAIGDTRTLADALGNLGVLADYRDDMKMGAAHYRESLALFRELGALKDIAGVLTWLGVNTMYQGDLDTATSLFTEALTLSRQVGDRQGEIFGLNNLGEVLWRKGEVKQAEVLVRESLILAQDTLWSLATAVDLELLAITASLTGMGERAARLLGAAHALRATSGWPQPEIEQRVVERQVATARAALGEERWAAAFAAGESLSQQAAVAEALLETHNERE